MSPIDAQLADYASTQDYLFSLKAKGVKYGVDRMRLLVAGLGHPERATPAIHIAGTNGKGSVAALLEACFAAAGWCTGLYTSPHLVKLGERVQVARLPLSEAEIVAFARELCPIAEAVSSGSPDDHPSFFEFMTAMAFLQFKRKNCDIALIETGLGGRLDATNVVNPEVAVITSIGLDHCEMLGDTIPQIAEEKAGIIKAGKPVVIGRLPPEAEAVIRRVAAEQGAPVHSVREIFGEDVADYPKPALEGDYQRANAAVAVLVTRCLDARWGLSAEVVGRGIAAVRWPGRWQRTTIGGRSLILDASHNPEGAGVLEAHLRQLVAAEGRKPVVVTGVLGVARARPLLETISRYAAEIHLVMPQQSRASSFEELEALIPNSFSGKVSRATVAGVFPAAGVCTVGGLTDTVVVTGSIYLLGEVLARIEPERGAIENRLQDF
ncbi:MAG: bifunctional folylpolyglutamate synthase/dihydrofolate synthase [Opitutus sp.]|nr:bifunctional folylpolyglutamate synthase/dihydrofolate synthase [Opitutus sp.]MCS6246004.1 bifunctional folylpolyglutamate synthase/dihydrofolate synthase [Opitutus sp.]MCS6273342.1 bifunctional folylpolyglutamate synthase/dihydrofolate synthase [Opitutus sp.]MCS6277143.1 bifunctional folylpolyglutamate synthase/dihydrofolate synthase [Opitutus sp.]MCS6300265.1 bifunctional folylpolyglutamate synthase/dihydrofolate synthase [Opitutus sp.]